MQTVIINGTEFDAQAVAALMDDEIREHLHSTILPCTEQEFVDAYLVAHLAKYGTEFVVN
jgi:hypothetical protein